MPAVEVDVQSNVTSTAENAAVDVSVRKEVLNFVSLLHQQRNLLSRQRITLRLSKAVILQRRKLFLVEVLFLKCFERNVTSAAYFSFLSAVEVNVQRNTTSTAESASVDVSVTKEISNFVLTLHQPR